MAHTDDSAVRSFPPRRGQRKGARGHAAAIRAGYVRLAFALLAALVGAELAALEPWLVWLWGYVVAAAGLQLLIHRRLCEGPVRMLTMGALDLAALTLVTVALGSAQSAIAFLYLLIPVTYATTTTRRRLSMVLAAGACLAYLGVLGAEYLGALARPKQALEPGQESLLVIATAGLVVFSIAVTTRLVSQLISALGGANHRLRELSQRDELTQLHNRRYLLHRMKGELARVQRGVPLAVVMVDLDGFKRVNDEEGHDAGDHLLVQMACALRKATRASDVVTRYGGDEFVVLLVGTDRAGADAVAGRIVDNAREVGRKSSPAIRVTASAGVVLAAPGDTASDLLRRSDAQAYEAKRAGGDRVALEGDTP